MKVLVIPDIHLGAALLGGRKDPESGINTRQLDYYRSLLYVLDDARKYGASCIVCTGDIFEHRYPSIIQQKLFSQALKYALELGYEEIHIVVGNHDQQRTTGANTLSYLQELKLKNIIVHEHLEYIEKDNALLTFMPYMDRKHLEAQTHDEAVLKLGAKLRELTQRASPSVRSKFLIGHMAIEGTFFAEEDADLYADNELMLPKSMFADYDATIMGHVHIPTIISSSPYIAYVGSLEKRGPSEQHTKKYALLNTETREIAYKDIPCRNYFEIKISFDTPKADFLSAEIMRLIDQFNNAKFIKDSILKCTLDIWAEDAGFFHEGTLMKAIYDKYKCNYILPIRPSFRTNRKVKDASITEQISDVEAFSKYIKSNFDDATSRKLIQAGSEIIQSYQDKI